MTCLPMAQALVLVPSTGNLYIYVFFFMFSDNTGEGTFSSPPRGIYISTDVILAEKRNTESSRPLHGESIYLQWASGIPEEKEQEVLVPSTGNLYIYRCILAQ